MISLKRYLGKRFLGPFLADAGSLLGAGGGRVAIFDSNDTPLAEAGSPSAPLIHRRPLMLGGTEAGHILTSAEIGEAAIDWLARTLQAFIQQEEARRAIADETLEQYRELSLLHRAAVSLNATLDPQVVAGTLLAELQHQGAASAGGCFQQGQKGTLTALALTVECADELAALAASPPMYAALADGRPRIVNQLSTLPEWAPHRGSLAHLLLAPLHGSNEEVIGLLALAGSDPAHEFHAADLKRAEVLASIAAGSLNNARLFQEALEVKNYNESLLKSLSNGVIALNREMLVNKANRAACQILGMSEEQILGHPLVQLLAPESAWAADWVQRVFAQGEPQVRLDCMLQSPHSQPVHLNLTSEPLSDANEQPIGVMLVLEDITREKRIKHTMGRYMTDKVVERLLAGDDSLLGGKEQPVSILFSDIRRFTGFVERLSPGEAVAQLNEYLSGMVDIVFDQGGTLDKFIGDAVMALFGAPFVSASDADHAVDAAVEMQRWLTFLNQRRLAKGQEAFNIGIGINTGLVIVGNIGSPKRMDFTVIGDHVNLAARLESANKFYGSKILISEYTYNALTRPHAMREIDKVRVMGRSQPVRVYELLDYHSENSFPNLDFVLERFTQGVEDFRARRFDAAAKSFGDVVKVKPNDKPSVIYLQRCLEYSEHEPPEDWSGVVDLGSK